MDARDERVYRHSAHRRALFVYLVELTRQLVQVGREQALAAYHREARQHLRRDVGRLVRPRRAERLVEKYQAVAVKRVEDFVEAVALFSESSLLYRAVALASGREMRVDRRHRGDNRARRRDRES